MATSTGEASEPRIWDPVETLDREALQTLQLERLRDTVGRVLGAQPVGAQRLAAAGIEAPRDIRDLDDLREVPFATKSDLRANYPFGLLAVPREQLVRVHASSGTDGKPTVVGYTRDDLETWSDLMARSMTMAGVRPGMMIHNANGYGLFTGGLGFHQGGERIGATVVPVSGGSPRVRRCSCVTSGLRSSSRRRRMRSRSRRRSSTPAPIRRTSGSSSGCLGASRGPRACARRSSARWAWLQ